MLDISRHDAIQILRRLRSRPAVITEASVSIDELLQNWSLLLPLVDPFRFDFGHTSYAAVLRVPDCSRRTISGRTASGDVVGRRAPSRRRDTEHL